MKPDIQNQTDVELLVDTFYGKVRQDQLLGPIFTDVARVNWDTHLPKMYAFWSGILLGTRGFSGNPMQKHMALSQKTPMEARHFDRWLTLFAQTLSECFEGPVAEEAMKRAHSIAGIMLFKIKSL